MKRCTECGTHLAESHFSRNKSKADGLATECRPCNVLKCRAYYRANRDRVNSANKLRGKQRYRDARLVVLAHYSSGTMACACWGCDESNAAFLSINHIYGGGGKDRATFREARTFYEYLVKRGFPVGFNVLCYNRNLALGFTGQCPHESEQQLCIKG